MDFTAIDVFCGCGGLTEGLKKAGFNVVVGIDNNKKAVETYKLNHPEAKGYLKNVQDLQPDYLLNSLNIKPGELDLLAGCPPCQGFSTLRTKNGSTEVDDKRNDLVYEFLNYVSVLKPKCIMMENVPALAKDYRIEDFLCTIKDLGYYVDGQTVQVLDAADYGVPQRRKRMILTASTQGKIPNAKPAKSKVTVEKAFSVLKPHGKSGDKLHDLRENRQQLTMKRIKSIPRNGGSRSQLPPDLQLDCHKRNPDSYKDVYGRMAWNEVSPTITSGCTNPSKGRFIHPDEDRAITLREAAILQSFPLDYKFDLSHGKGAIALMIGNALPPEFIRRHSKTIFNHLRNVTSWIG